LLVSCGESSGDLYAAEVVRHLRARHPDLEVVGLGGDRVAAEGARLLAHVRELAVVGLVEVLGHLPRLRRILGSVLDEVDRAPPDAALLVDYGGFNLRLAKALHQRGIPVAYYVSPQVWAWRRGRVKAIRRYVRRMLVIFPFEEDFYREAGVPVSFVGHPLVDVVGPRSDPSEALERLGLDPERPVVPLLPGSRPNEVRLNLPPLLGATRGLARRRPDLQLAVAAPATLPRALAEDAWAGLPVRVFRDSSRDLLAVARAAIVASGTATVEAALLDAPMAVVYRVAWLSYLLGRPFVHVPHYAMVNLIAQRRIVPELIQHGFTAQRVEAAVMELLEDPERERRMRADLAEVRRRLGEPGASVRAAEAVSRLLERSPEG
jgi:lipid-A-disaccharide synthase